MSENTNENETLINAALALGAVRDVNGTPFSIVPENCRVEDLSRMLPAPVRNKGNATMRDEDSFIAYVNMHGTDSTDLFYSINPPVFKAVFNSARTDGPAWGDFIAVFPCPLSPEWKSWNAGNGQKMGQEDFARFVEANLPDIIEPEAAQMLEIALTLEAKKKVNFASGLRLSNGSNQLTYEEQVDGSAAKGKLTIPDVIVLGIPVFENGQAYRVEAKFRYRIAEGGKLTMWYELVRPHKIVEDAVKALKEKIETTTGLVAMNGTGI